MATLPPLPDPDEISRLMGLVASRVTEILVRMRLLAIKYGVHGWILTTGGFEFQLTRVNEKWSIYLSSQTMTKRDLEYAKMDEKILFLEHAETFESDYSKRILELYGKLKKTTAGKL